MIGGSGVAVSLAGVTFMDSAIIHALVIGDRKLAESGRRLVLYAEPGSPADRVLELCRLNETLLFGDTLDEAIVFARQTAEPTPAA
jgi:anti-anti-sigma regulatory factor